MKYEVILTDDYKEIKFTFSSFECATEFIETALSHSVTDIKAQVSIVKEGE